MIMTTTTMIKMRTILMLLYNDKKVDSGNDKSSCVTGVVLCTEMINADESNDRGGHDGHVNGFAMMRTKEDNDENCPLFLF